jgi:hypothetical protein
MTLDNLIGKGLLHEPTIDVTPITSAIPAKTGIQKQRLQARKG